MYSQGPGAQQLQLIRPPFSPLPFISPLPFVLYFNPFSVTQSSQGNLVAVGGALSPNAILCSVYLNWSNILDIWLFGCNLYEAVVSIHQFCFCYVVRNPLRLDERWLVGSKRCNTRNLLGCPGGCCAQWDCYSEKAVRQVYCVMHASQTRTKVITVGQARTQPTVVLVERVQAYFFFVFLPFLFFYQLLTRPRQFTVSLQSRLFLSLLYRHPSHTWSLLNTFQTSHGFSLRNLHICPWELIKSTLCEFGQQHYNACEMNKMSSTQRV